MKIPDIFSHVKTKHTELTLIVTLAFCIGLLSFHFGLLRNWQEKIYDQFFIRSESPTNIVIVALDDESIQTLGGWPVRRHDVSIVVNTMKSAGAIGIDLAFTDLSSFGGSDDQKLQSTFKENSASIVIPFQIDNRGGKTIDALPYFSEVAQVGYVNMLLDSDGVIRRFNPTTTLLDQKKIISFSERLAEIYAKKNGESLALFSERLRINYQGPAKTVLTVPFIDVYNGTLPESIWKDKVVLIGATANDLHDILQTPFGAMPGVEVHANALHTLLNKDFFKQISFFGLLCIFLLASLIPAFCIVRIKKLFLLISILVLVFVGMNVLGVVLFMKFLLFPSLAVSLTFLLSTGGTLVYQYVAESAEKKKIKDTFQYYLMPEVVNDLMNNPEKLKLGGEKRKVTILFSDIRGFTTISEALSPEMLTKVINEYLTAMTDCIMEDRGLVDKYIGDAIMAFWGAPLDNPLQGKDACMSVLSMSRILKKLNVDWQSRGLPPLGIGIGINTGEVIVGNMGSEKRFNYTIMGDEVNFGSRLEGLNKSYGTECLISESTYLEIKNDPQFLARELDFVMVKGKKEPKLIYELVTQDIDKEVAKKVFGLFAQGRAAYAKGEWDKAISLFKEVLSIHNDGPSATFLERSLYLKEHQPENWQGVYEFKTK